MVPGNSSRDASLIERLVSEFEDEAKKFQLLSQIALDIHNRKSSVVGLVESLNGFLTSPETPKQNFGVEVLANVLDLLPRDFLSSKELTFILEFFNSKLTQHHSFIPAVTKGYNVLVQSSEISDQSLYDILAVLQSNVVWQTQAQVDRRTYYSMLQYFVFNRIERNMKNISSQFLFTMITAIDGERDPKNLLLLFSFLPRLYSSLPLGTMTEDAFEAVSCYFPIDYHSTSSAAGSVSRDDLVKALIPCLLAAPEFVEFCIPLIQEKLDSSLKSAKLDSYELLTEGCAVWPPGSLEPYLEPLWVCVKQDTLPPRDTQIADSAMCALQALIRATPPASLPSLIGWVVRSCEGFLSDVQLSLFEPSARLLLSAMAASPAACTIVANLMLPRIVSLLQVTPEASKPLVLNKVITFVNTFLQNNPTSDCNGESWSGLFHGLVQCCREGAAELQEAAYSALTAAAGCLEADCRAALYPHMLALLTHHPAGPLRARCIECLQALALVYGDEVEANVVKYLVTDQGAEEAECSVVQNKFNAVCAVAITERFHTTLAQQFAALVSQGSAFTSVALTCLSNLLEDEKVQTNSPLTSFLFNQSSVIPTLINLNAGGDDLLNAARIIHIIVRLQSSSDQRRVVQPLIEHLLHVSDCTQKMVLLAALICPLWPDVAVSVLTVDQVISVVLPAALGVEASLTSTSALQLIASLINKATDDMLLDLVSKHLQNCPIQQTAIAHPYITKAIVLRNHPTIDHWLNKLVDLLDNETVGDVAAEGVQLVVEESLALNRQNHCCVRLLYRQRVFDLLVPRLVNSSHRVQHLKALVYLLQSVPHSVYLPHIKQILPLLLKSLDTDSNRLLLTVLRTLASLLETHHSCLDQHLDTCIPRLLYLSRHPPDMQVRMSALQCLSSLLKCSPILLLPHKTQVLSGLVPCLDDKKRLVRKAAARTRSKWFLLGAPTDDP